MIFSLREWRSLPLKFLFFPAAMCHMRFEQLLKYMHAGVALASGFVSLFSLLGDSPEWRSVRLALYVLLIIMTIVVIFMSVILHVF